MPAPPLPWVSASVPKAGHAAAENEDAAAATPGKLRFAVADGATEGWQSGGWAKHLATAYARRPPTPADFAEWLAETRRAWTPPPVAASWYAEVKQEQGSFATLVGVEFRPATAAPGYLWKAVAVGDSCLLVLRGDRFETAFPVSAAADFDTRPPLVPSSPATPCPVPEWLAGRAEPGDLVLLATDAVARFLLALPAPVADDPVVEAARADAGSARPGRLVQSLRRLSADLHDDSTLLAVLIPAPPPESPR